MKQSQGRKRNRHEYIFGYKNSVMQSAAFKIVDYTITKIDSRFNEVF